MTRIISFFYNLRHGDCSGRVFYPCETSSKRKSTESNPPKNRGRNQVRRPHPISHTGETRRKERDLLLRKGMGRGDQVELIYEGEGERDDSIVNKKERGTSILL